MQSRSWNFTQNTLATPSINQTLACNKEHTECRKEVYPAATKSVDEMEPNPKREHFEYYTHSYGYMLFYKGRLVSAVQRRHSADEAKAAAEAEIDRLMTKYSKPLGEISVQDIPTHSTRYGDNLATPEKGAQG